MPQPIPKSRAADPAPLITLVAFVLLLWHGLLALDYLNYWFGDDWSGDWRGGSEGWAELAGAMDLGALWAWVGWGIAVICGLTGSIFLLARDDASVLLLFGAACGAALAAIGDTIAVGLDVALASTLLVLPRLAMLALLVLVPLAGWLYARSRNAAGQLQ